MKRLLVLIFLIISLSACGNDPNKPDTSPSGHFSTITVTVEGKKIPCITWKNRYSGGLSCDWTAK